MVGFVRGNFVKAKKDKVIHKLLLLSICTIS